uniref:Integrase core domain containing protein n=1 Tax=Solanum tuberosum TaxID=4113 RepID=M1DRY8_SOLTU
MKNEIGAHRQLSGEALHHTWWRFCQRLKKCLNHGLNERHLKRIFYRSLNFVTKPIVDAFCGGSVMRKPFLEIMIVIYDVSNNNRAWHTKDAEGQLSTSLNSRKNGSPPSDTIENPKKDGHYLAITTRSGKILNESKSAATEQEQSIRRTEEEEVEAKHVDDTEGAQPTVKLAKLKENKSQGNLALTVNEATTRNECGVCNHGYDERELEAAIEESFVVETLVTVLMNFEEYLQDDYVETLNALQGMGSNSYALKKLDLVLKNRPNPSAKPSIEEPHVLELKQLPSHLRKPSGKDTRRFTKGFTVRLASRESSGIMGPRRKSAPPHTLPPPSLTPTENEVASSSSEVQINTKIEDHSSRATRSRTTRATVQHTPF